MWSLFVFSICLAVGSVHGQSTEVSQCINHEGELPINTEVVGCDVPPCVLPQLQDVVLNVVFKAPRTMRTMSTLVTAYLSVIGIPVPVNYPLEENAVTCNFLTNTYCPVIKDEVVQYQLRMFIESFFPVPIYAGSKPRYGTQATLEFRVVDEANQPALCIRVGIRVVAATGTLGTASNNATLVINH